MSLNLRIEKLERGTGLVEIIIIRDCLSEAEKDAFVREHLHAEGLAPSTTILRLVGLSTPRIPESRKAGVELPPVMRRNRGDRRTRLPRYAGRDPHPSVLV